MNNQNNTNIIKQIYEPLARFTATCIWVQQIEVIDSSLFAKLWYQINLSFSCNNTSTVLSVLLEQKWWFPIQLSSLYVISCERNQQKGRNVIMESESWNCSKVAHLWPGEQGPSHGKVVSLLTWESCVLSLLTLPKLHWRVPLLMPNGSRK